MVLLPIKALEKKVVGDKKKLHNLCKSDGDEDNRKSPIKVILARDRRRRLELLSINRSL